MRYIQCAPTGLSTQDELSRDFGWVRNANRSIKSFGIHCISAHAENSVVVFDLEEINTEEGTTP